MTSASRLIVDEREVADGILRALQRLCKAAIRNSHAAGSGTRRNRSENDHRKTAPLTQGSPGRTTPPRSRKAPVDEGVGIVRLEPNGLGVILQRALHVAFGAVCNAPVVEGEGIVRVLLGSHQCP